MSNETYRAAFLRRSLLAGAALAVLAGPSAAFAAEAAAADAGQVEEIVITGSRLRVAAPVGSSMIDVGRDVIAASTAINTTQLTQQVPQVLNLGVSDSSRGQSGGAANTTYSNAINIRGLGPYSTLTLIDGHRAVPQGSTGYAVDPSVIPTIAIQRLEIVADGASAIYGSDAVAGVANIILRRNLNGAEAQIRYGDGDHYLERQYSAIAGKTWKTGQLTVAGESTYRDNVNGRHRDFFKSDLRSQGGGDYSVTLCNPGNIVVGGVSYAIPAGGVTAANRSALTPGTSNRCDPFKSADLLPQQKREGAMFTFNQEITPWFKVKADGFYSRREFVVFRNWLSSTLTVPSSNAYFVAPPGLTPASESVQVSFEGIYPQSRNTGFSKSRSVHVGAEVKAPKDWRIVTDFTTGRNDERIDTGVVTFAANQTAALASNNPATALNVFGGPNNPAVIASALAGVNTNMGVTHFEDFQWQADGGLFTMPGGQARMAFGYEGQRLKINPTNIDQSAAAPRTRTKVRTRAVDSGFAELLLPLVGTGNSSHLIEKFDINLAGRYDHYDDVGDTWNPKIGFNWGTGGGLTIHGSYGTSFRAPALTQLYGTGGGVLALFVQSYSDPTCGCVRQGLASSGENPNLVPETARTFSLGFDYKPPSVSGLSISVNAFDIFYKKQIQAYISDLSVLGRESQFAGTGVITRNPSQQFVTDILASAQAVTGVVPTPLTLFVNGNALNTGNTKAQGLDFLVGYNFGTKSMGDFSLNLAGAYFIKYRQSIGPAGPLNNVLNTIYNPLRFKTRVSGQWRYGPVDAGVAVSYVNSYKNNLVNPVQKVKAYAPVDLRLGYSLKNVLGGPGVKLSLDVRNAFNVKPPFVDVAQSPNGGGGYDATAADPTGRVVSLVLDAKF